MIEVIAQKGFIAGAILALGALLGVILKSVLPYRKSMIDTLRDRVDKLEDSLEAERAARAAEVSLLRHRVANAETALDLFIELIEAQPAKASKHAARIKAMRERDRASLAQESATIRAASIVAASCQDEKQAESGK